MLWPLGTFRFPVSAHPRVRALYQRGPVTHKHTHRHAISNVLVPNIVLQDDLHITIIPQMTMFTNDAVLSVPLVSN